MKSVRVLLAFACCCFGMAVMGCSEGTGAPEAPENPTSAPKAGEVEMDVDKNVMTSPPLD
jgi:hypothetical protein